VAICRKKHGDQSLKTAKIGISTPPKSDIHFRFVLETIGVELTTFLSRLQYLVKVGNELWTTSFYNAVFETETGICASLKYHFCFRFCWPATASMMSTTLRCIFFYFIRNSVPICLYETRCSQQQYLHTRHKQVSAIADERTRRAASSNLCRRLCVCVITGNVSSARWSICEMINGTLKASGITSHHSSACLTWSLVIELRHNLSLRTLPAYTLAAWRSG